MTARHVVEVKAGVAQASRQGYAWWLAFRQSCDPISRIEDVGVHCIVDTTALVACDDREHAEWLAAHMVGHGGLPKSAVRVRAIPEAQP